MESTLGFLWPLAALSGVGAFIDFLVGRSGQVKARDWMTTWWVRFNDVSWRNFGKAEAEYTYVLFQRMFGAKILSWRRAISTLTILTVSMVMVMLVVGYNWQNHLRLTL